MCRTPSHISSHRSAPVTLARGQHVRRDRSACTAFMSASFMAFEVSCCPLYLPQGRPRPSDGLNPLTAAALSCYEESRGSTAAQSEDLASMADAPRFYLTTAIDYPNSRPHIGTAFEKIGADVQARYRRMEGYEVFFLMGNDENTVKVAKQAAELGQRSQGLLRRHGPAVPGGLATPWTSATTTSSRPASRATTRAAASSSRRSTTTATSTRAATRAGTARAARRSRPRRRSRKQRRLSRSTRRRRCAAASRATSSRCRSSRIGCSSFYEEIPGLHPAGEPPQRNRHPRADRTAGRQHHALRRRRGASACRSTRSSPSRSGSTPC